MSFNKSLLAQCSDICKRPARAAVVGLMAVASLASVGCGPVSAEDDVANQSELIAGRELQVRFNNCIEFGGVGLVPTVNVQNRVPSQYMLVPGPPGLSIFVAHMAKCQDIKVGGISSGAGLMGHLGVLIVPPTGTGSFNNYLFSHVTDDAVLFAALKVAGLQTTYINPRMRFDVQGSGSNTTLDAAVQRPHPLAFTLSGPFALPDASQPPSTNLINYWTDSDRAGNAVLEYNISGVRVQPTPNVVLNALGADLQAMVGTAPLPFPFFAAGESFESTTMTFRPNAF